MAMHTSLIVPLALWCACLCLLLTVPTALAFVAPSHSTSLLSYTPLQSKLFATPSEGGADTSNYLTHSDVEWRLRPPEDTSRMDKLKYKLGANVVRLDNKLKGGEPPPFLCPKGGRALLTAYYKEPGQRKKKIARFGFTTSRGPSSPDIDTTIRETYKINPPPLSASIAAIIYMFVEPDYRSRNVGALALEVISAIQSVQVVDFTVLVADDNGSGGLVKWYEEHGYSRAPLMQNMMGSPNKENGVTMIAPVKIEEGFFSRCTIKWW